MSYYLGFDVNRINALGAVENVSNPTVQIYDVTNGVSLGTVSGDLRGVVPAGSLAVTAGTLVRFSVSGYTPFIERVTTSSPVYTGVKELSLVIENLYAETYAAAVYNDIWVREGEFGEPRHVGTIEPSGILDFPFNPATDYNLQFFAIARTAQGAADTFDLARAVRMDVTFNRETQVPVIYLAEAAENTSAKIAVTNYTTNAKYRKTEVSFNNTFTQMDGDPIVDNTLNQAARLPETRVLPRTVNATYDADLTLAKTKYVRVSHSSNGFQWGEPSNVLTITYPDSSGTGGSGGDTPPPPGEGLPPSDLNANLGLSFGDVDLDWTNNGAGGTITIEGSYNGSSYVGMGQVAASPASGTQNHTLEALVAGKWKFRVSDSNAIGYAYSANITVS